MAHNSFNIWSRQGEAMKHDNLDKHLLILGCGYVGRKLAQTCLKQGIKVKATVRSSTAKTQLTSMGVDVCLNENPALLTPEWLRDCNHVLDSIPLARDEEGQPFQSQSQWLPTLLTHMPHLSWAGYLSSTSVYANSDGAWIDETTTHFSDSPRGIHRLAAEQAWLNSSAPTEIFRLSGIYGDERNITGKLLAGNYKAVSWSPAHYANRIHVDDITAALMQAMHKPKPARIVNLADDFPYPHAAYVCELAELIQAPSPIILSPDEAKQQLSPAFLSFFSDNKRISNQKLHQELLSTLKYPSFREAASSLLKKIA